MVVKYVFKSEFDSNPFIGESFIFSCVLRRNVRQTIDVLMKVFEEYVGDYFGKPVVKNGNVTYPANKIVRYFIDNFVSLVFESKVDIAVIDRLLGLFNGTIDRFQDLRSYLFLVWIKIYVVAGSPKQFGIEFGERLKFWIEDVGSGFLHKAIPFVADLLKLKCQYEMVGRLKVVISGLRELRTENCYVVIAILLNQLRDGMYDKS